MSKAVKIVLDKIDRMHGVFLRRAENKKFKDPRRVKIHSQIHLTDEQKRSIDELYVTNYGSKIPYTWHRHFTAYTGRFDEKYFPELLFIPEFEHFMNAYGAYNEVLQDKNFFPLVVRSVGGKTARTLLSVTKGMYRNAEYAMISREEALALLSNLGKAFCKPSVDSSSGRGCFLVNMQNGIDALTGKTAETVLADMGNDYIIQECLVCHDSIRAIYPDSVNTFRIFTYRWKDEILHFPSIMRIGRGGSVIDNAHAGGIFIGVKDDGQLCESAFTEFRDEFKSHPDTGVVFADTRLELFPKALAEAKRLHAAIPQIGIINWDFTLDQNGDPVVIEANTKYGSIWLTEMAHGCGAFGEKTAEVLRWLRLMKKTKLQERHKYTFGVLPE